jgi:hypothetical protein
LLRCARNDVDRFEYDFTIPQRHAPEDLLENLTLENQRAQGRPGARRTRGLVRNCCKGMLRPSIQVWRKPPAFPAQWLYGLYVIALVTLLFAFCDTIARKAALAAFELDACIGASDPHDFAVR